MAIDVLMAQSPLSVPAITYDRIWVEVVEISAPSPAGEVTANVRLRRYALLPDGSVATDPESFRLTVTELLQKSATDTELAAALTATMAYIAKVGVAEGIIQGQS